MDSPQRAQRSRRRKDKETRRGGDREKRSTQLSPCLRVSRSPCLTHCALWFFCGYFFWIAAEASAGPQEVMPVDGAAFQGDLVSIDADGRVTFRVAGQDNKVAEDRTLS